MLHTRPVKIIECVYNFRTLASSSCPVVSEGAEPNAGMGVPAGLGYKFVLFLNLSRLIIGYLWTFLVLYCAEVIIFCGQVNFNCCHIVCPTLPVSPFIHLLHNFRYVTANWFSLSIVVGRNASEWEMFRWNSPMGAHGGPNCLVASWEFQQATTCRPFLWWSSGPSWFCSSW